MKRDKLRSLLIIAGTLAVLLILLLGPRDERTEEERITVQPPDSIFELPASPEPTFAGTVSKNTSFFDLMLSCNLTPQEIKDIEHKAKDVYNFRRIYPGQEYELYTAPDGRLEKLTFAVNDESYIEVTRNSGEIAAERKEYPFEVVSRTASGIITHSLFLSLQEQGLPLKVGAKLSDLA